MNLKSRIGELLQGQPSGSGRDALDSEAMAQQRQREEEAHKQHMRRLLAIRHRELDELREIMVRHRHAPQGDAASKPCKGASASGAIRPPGRVDGSQLISLINELEVKVLSEPMGLAALPLPKAAAPVAARRESGWPSHSGASKAHPLDDAALMVAARRWDHAADSLVKAIRAGDLGHGVDWATRSAIDLFERAEQTERAMAMRRQYRQSHGHEPDRVLPLDLNGSATGQLRVCASLPWKCPAHLGPDVPMAMSLLLNSGEAGSPLVMDWTAVASIDAAAMDELRLSIEKAIRSRNTFVHVGLPALIRVARQELQNQKFSRAAWGLWLALLNWTGFRNAHRTAAVAYARRFLGEEPVYLGLQCICQSLDMPAGGAAEDLVCAASLLGHLTHEQAQELDHLELRPAMPGRLVVLDARRLASVDFFFGADLLNWSIQRYSRGEMVSIAYAHPLLAHFFQMLGLQHHARLHG